MGPFWRCILENEGVGRSKSESSLPCGGQGRAEHTQLPPPDTRPGCWERFGADPAASSRFDLMGLTPDAPEDEAGIKKAAENSKRLWGGGSAELLGASHSLGQEWVCSFHLSFLCSPVPPAHLPLPEAKCVQPPLAPASPRHAKGPVPPPGPGCCSSVPTTFP